jgi:hypothetical protein
MNESYGLKLNDKKDADFSEWRVFSIFCKQVKSYKSNTASDMNFDVLWHAMSIHEILWLLVVVVQVT